MHSPPLFFLQEAFMPVYLEDPAATAAGFATSPGGLMTRTKQVCPHGFSPNKACQCFLNRERDPGLEGCVGRQFEENDPLKETIPVVTSN